MSAALLALNGLLTREQRRAVQVPAFSTYLLVGGFLVTALLVWSWAERAGRQLVARRREVRGASARGADEA